VPACQPASPGQLPGDSRVARIPRRSRPLAHEALRLRSGAVNPDTMVLPVNGTREALFSFVQAVVDDSTAPGRRHAQSLLPDLRGSGPARRCGAPLLNTTAATGYLPDLDAVGEYAWRRCQVLFLCSPAIRRVPCCPWIFCAMRSLLRSGMTSSLPRTSVTPRSTWTTAPLPRDCCRRRLRQPRQL